MTLLSDTAYHSFIEEVEALNTTTIRRLTRSRRHQLLVIALACIRLTEPDKLTVPRQVHRADIEDEGRVPFDRGDVEDRPVMDKARRS
jgi:hypothetical protein